MIAFALLIPPGLLAAVILLARFEERMFAPPRAPQPQPPLRLLTEKADQDSALLPGKRAA
ncbi:hypothetical protein [Kitasatospora sp. McL0602]|uniref:hypothetical protein n=1 Tax=Kitasatospora sp. McL0602 TaxID=3439530 RepID=UPI003F886840